MKSGMQPNDAVTCLFEERPFFHTAPDGQSTNWAIRKSVLDWLAANVKPDSVTLETGAGYSTVVFASCGARHTAISPFGNEHARIRDWCERHGIGCDKVRFVASASQHVLPALQTPPLDAVLIDGAHAFPFPYLDWFFLAEHLKVGGSVLVDDTQLRSVLILKEFLLAERGRWSLTADLGQTAVFRKTSAEVFSKQADWPAQPFCADFEARRLRQTFRGRVKAIPLLGPLVHQGYRLLRMRR
ncbi:MAG: class I SAM-dependent methyltransferase [Kiritimatiellae bacterium]|nr:class I SAM-dependent methyltransferase [Kiritimatiellia bacterium]